MFLTTTEIDSMTHLTESEKAIQKVISANAQRILLDMNATVTECFACTHLHNPESAGQCDEAECLSDCRACHD